MKNLKLVTLGFGLLVAAASYGQRVPQQNDKVNSQSTAIDHADYVLGKDKLVNYFVSGEIPADFPKYDANLSKEENEEIAKTWAKKNIDLFTEEAKAKFNL
ncbi:MAG: hypothetical protein H6599_03350 [Flavobacteriales bacterium]|nr:hypothetical protein [Flavobacteriales bacterium]